MDYTKAGTYGSHVVVVLDGSVSMSFNKEKTIQAFNDFLKSQKESEIQTTMTILTFHGSGEFKYISNDLEAPLVQELTTSSYVTAGGTDLLDAVGDTINSIEQKLNAIPDGFRPSIIVAIITDGEENASRRFKHSEIKDMIGSAEAAEWSFMFLASNIDAFAAGNSMGISSMNTMAYSDSNIAASTAAMTRYVGDMKSAKLRGMNNAEIYGSMAFTDEERTSAK